MSEKRQLLLEQLNAVIAHVLDVYHGIPDSNIPVYELWTAKDILAHLTFWHESFARNIHDLAHNTPPTPLKGKLSDLNQMGVDSMQSTSLAAIIQRLENAHTTIQQHILKPEIVLIPYRKGSRDYTPEEHLEVVIKHINKHLHDVVKVCRRDRINLTDTR